MMNVLWMNDDDVEGLLDTKGALEVVAGIKPERTDDDEIAIFDSAWLAIRDISTANPGLSAGDR